MFLNSIRMPQLCLGVITIVFLVIWLTAWALNALKGTHFDLNSLKDMYVWLMTQMNATHAINSIWNSPRGNLPLEGGCSSSKPDGK